MTARSRHYRTPDSHISRTQRSYTKTPSVELFLKDSKVSNVVKTIDMKDVECVKKRHYTNKSLTQMARMKLVFQSEAARRAIQ